MVEKYLRVDEAAARLGLKPQTVCRWLRAGRLRGSKIPSRAKGEWRVPESAVVEVLEANPNTDTAGA